jgi:hypothetical protein
MADLAYYADANWTNTGVAVGVLRKGDESWHCPHQHSSYVEAFACAVTWAKRENALALKAPRTEEDDHE